MEFNKYNIYVFVDRLFMYINDYGNCFPSRSVVEKGLYEILACKECGYKDNKKIAYSITIFNNIKTYKDFYDIVVLKNDTWYFEEDMLKVIKYYLDYKFLS